MCPKCDTLVPFGDFTKNRANPNGIGTYCKSCAVKSQAAVRVTAIDAWEHAADCTCRVCAERIATRSKRCSKCQILKPADNFSRSLGAIDGLQSWCKECLSELIKREGRWGSRKRKYNLDKQSFWDLFNSQGGQCAGCNNPVEESRMEVDHDHRCCPGDKTCGECVRGLLCHSCNVALAMIKDDPNRALALAAYLMRFEDVLTDTGDLGADFR